MRLLIAAAVFVVSVVLAGLGYAQRTIWAPPTSVSISAEFEHTSPFAVIPNSTLSLHPGNPTISVTGADAGVFLSSGRENDVLAFVGKSTVTELALSKSKSEIEAKQTLGVAAGFSPVGSDLWREEAKGTGSASLKISTQDDAAVLIASNGLKATPGQIKIVWPIFFDLTLSNAMLIAGAALLLAAVVLTIWHFTDLRRKRGPKRRLPKAPSGPKYKERRKVKFAPARGRRAAGRRAMVIPAALATIGLLSGCSVGQDSAAPTSSPTASAGEVSPPVVTEAQLGRILRDVAAAAKKADASNDKKFLSPRFAGPALNLRTVHYFLRSKDNKIAVMPAVVAKPLSFSLPAASTTWPRSVMAVTDEPGDAALPQLVVLQQKSPRENYQVWYTVRLMPGAKIPAVPGAETGAIPVDANSLFLKVPPQSVPATYGDLINKGASSLSAELFDTSKDEFYKQVSSSQVAQVKNLENGKIAFTHKLGDANVISLSTSQAGALVAVYMTDTYLIRPTKVGTAVGVSGQEALILGANGSTKGVRSIYGNMMLFFVPALSETAKIRLIGVTQGLVSVRGL
ncbi:MAG: hypothetical protein RJA66_175 [Actinomycetota bacterium]|jgi:hypothetical protein